MAVVNAISMQWYDSWTDNDLVRAIELDPDCKDEYLTELASRRINREQMAEKTAALQGELQAKIEELLNGR